MDLPRVTPCMLARGPRPQAGSSPCLEPSLIQTPRSLTRFTPMNETDEKWTSVQQLTSGTELSFFFVCFAHIQNTKTRTKPLTSWAATSSPNTVGGDCGQGWLDPLLYSSAHSTKARTFMAQSVAPSTTQQFWEMSVFLGGLNLSSTAH